MSDRAYRDEDCFREVYFNDSLTVTEVAKELGCDTATLYRWKGKHGIERGRDTGRRPSEKEYAQEETLRELYHVKGLSRTEIAEKYNLHPTTILHHMKRHGVERRDIKESQRLQAGRYYTEWRGYVRYQGGMGDTIHIHRLLAICKGHDPHKVFSGEYDVHHENGVRWDNRLENITLLTHAEHKSLENNIRYGNVDRDSVC